MPDAVPSPAEVRRLLGKFSIASVKSWLKTQNVGLTANSRDALVERVHELLKREKISKEQLEAGLIQIEEASSKRIHVFKIDPTVANLKQISSQMKSLGIAPSPSRVAAPQLPSSPRLVYLTDDANTIRAKWAEKHTRYVSELPSLTYRPVHLTKVIVLDFNKTTGVIQLRYDKPERGHTHGLNGKSTAEEYFSHYKEKVEGMFGMALEGVELRPALEKIINASPRIVEVAVNEQLTDDGLAIKVTAKQKGKDVRDGRDWGAMSKHGAHVRTHEVESVRWLPEPSGGKLARRVFTHIDGRLGFIRVDADCHEVEINYVLGHLV